jgi:hypothetical protein
VDLNLNTLKHDILEYLGTSGLAVFYGSSGGLQGLPMVLWDVEGQPDFRAFLEVARNAGAQLVIFAAREFEPSDLDSLLEQLEELELSRDERRDLESRLRALRGYEGATCSIELAFDLNSRLYVYEVQPDWYEDFLAVEDEVVSRAAEAEDEDDDEPLGGYYSKN